MEGGALLRYSTVIDAMSYPESHTADGCGCSLCQNMDTRHYFMLIQPISIDFERGFRCVTTPSHTNVWGHGIIFMASNWL